MYIDLDRFKHINDTWGHEQGDNALVAMANLMKSTFKSVDLIARQGGDEFVIMLANTLHEEANQAMREFDKRVAQFNQQSGNTWQLACSSVT